MAVFIGTGLGTRMPWPADEPRFALIARDMVHTGDWLFPRVGGDLYPDKPPVFFWLLSVGYWLTGSLRASFLAAVVRRRLHGASAWSTTWGGGSRGARAGSRRRSRSPAACSSC